jgi:integrase
MKFTKDTAATLAPPPGKADFIAWDEDLPGFGLRFRQTKRSWVIQYRLGAQQRRESLGDTRKIDLDAARKIARKRFAQVELGIDPKAEKGKADADAAAAKRTLAAVATLYLDFKQPTLRPSSYAAAKRYFELHWEPLRNRSLVSIERADVADRLQEIAKEHGRVAAGRARANLSALFTWAAKEGLCEVNPVAITNDPAAGVRSRERVLSDPEIAAIWHACGDDDFGAITRLLVLTGQRRNEIGGLRWSEIDLDAATVTLPPARTKNDRGHIVPLSPAATAILEARGNRSGRDLLFGKRDRAFTGWGHAKNKLDAAIAAAGKPLAAWTLHDARRSAASGMQKLGVRVEVIERALNHVSGSYRGVAGIYQVNPLTEDVRTALTRWSEHVLAVVEGRKSKVVSLRSA